MNLTTIRRTFADYGWAAGLHEVAKRSVNRVVPVRILRAIKLTTETVDRDYLDLPEGLTGRFLDEAGVRTLAAEPRHDLDEAFVRQALRKGDSCYAIFDGDTLAAYGWYSRWPTRISPSLILHFDPAFSYMHKGLTLPEYRGKRLHAIGMARALAALEREGLQGILSYVESTNFASQRSCHRLGYLDLGSIYVVGAPGHEYAASTGNCRRYGIWVESRTRTEGEEDRSSGDAPRHQPSHSAT